MKRAMNFLLYVGLGGLVFSLIYFRSILEFFEHQDGILLPVFNVVKGYFRNADNFNLLCLMLFVCISLIAFIVIDIGVGKVLRWVTKTKPFLNRIVHSGWFFMTIQKGMSILLLGALFILSCNVLIIIYGNSHSATEASAIESPRPVLVLGTSKMLRSGKGENLYYTYRIQSAVEAWKAEKASYFIVSGDRAGEHYDETRDMKKDLMTAGVPEEKIKLDTAGYRTLDSMLRIREMYRTKELVVISQGFHVQRALFLGSFYGIDGVGLTAKGSSTVAMALREFFVSKPSVVMDLILFNMQPKVLVSNSTIKYRQDITITSDLSLILFILIGVAMISTLGFCFKYMEAPVHS